MRLFLLIFSILAIAIFAFHFQATIYDATTEPWTKLLAFICAQIILLFDGNAYADGVMILTDPALNAQHFSGVQIVAGCNGIEAWLVLLAAIMSFPPYSRIRMRWILLGMAIILLLPVPAFNAWFSEHAWLFKGLLALLFLTITQFFSPLGRYKLIGLLLGFVAIQSINVLRVISLFYIGQWDKEIFDLAHLYLWQALIILDAFIVFLIWLAKMPNIHHDDNDPKNPPNPPAEENIVQHGNNMMESS